MLDTTTELAPNQGMMCVLNQEGDTKIIWNRDNNDEIAAARATFDSLKTKGYAAYSVKGKDGEKGEVIHKFDPNAERLIMAPAMKGG